MKKIRYAALCDLYLGLLRRFWWFLPAIVWGLYVSFRVDRAFAGLAEMGMLAPGTAFSFGDVCLYAFQGQPVFDLAMGDPFEIPVEWLIWQVYIALLLSQYTYKNLCGIGQQVLLRLQKRRYWWTGKCVWAACSVLLAYAAFFGTTTAYCAVRGTLRAEISPIMSMLAGNVRLSPTAAVLNWGQLAVLILVTVLISIVFSQWQVTLELFCKPLGAFLAVVTVWAACAYIPLWIFPGNYAIWVRNVDIGLFGTFTAWHGAIYGLALYIPAVVLGGVRFAKYNVLQIRE